MKHVRKLLPAICCVPLLGGCAANQTTSGQAWNVTPVTGLKHGLNDPEAWYQVGRYYQGQKRYAQASEAFHKVLEANPQHVEALNGLGVIYAAQGKYAEAVAEFQAALRISSGSSHINNNLGYALYLQGDYEGAVAALKQAVESDPSNRKALNNLGLAYAKTDNHKDSAQAFVDAVTQKKQPGGEAGQSAASDAPATLPTTAAMAADGEAAQVKAAEVEASPVAASREAGESSVAAIKAEEASLALPKDRGVIVRRQVELPVRESSTTVVMVAPSVYELHEKSEAAAVAASTPISKDDGSRQNYMQVASTTPALTLSKVSKPGVEVSNGNGITGLARKVAYYLRVHGYSTNRLTNHKPFNVTYSRIYYRNGYQEAARQLSISLPQQPVMIQSESLRKGTDIRLVLGKNATTHWAYLENPNGNVNFAWSAFTQQPVL